MTDKNLIRKSKWLSKHLRHAPEEVGLTLGPGGWVSVDDLLDAARRAKFSISHEELNLVVSGNDKQRFAFDETGTNIRANQGHSVEVDLELEPVVPPNVLYHGTGAQNREVIQREGLAKMRRHHVHLSPDTETAHRVGSRHGKPLIFRVDAVRMHAEGHVFYCSQNGVWLVDEVPPQYLQTND